ASGGASGKTNSPAVSYGATSGSLGRAINNVGASSIATTPSCGILAVTFLEIKAQASNGAVNLQWNVAYEVSTTGYSIERSTDGANFESIGSVAYRAGDATNNAYQYTDNGAQTLGGTLYYRIQELGSDGSTMYSRIVSVNLGTATGKVGVYPNPARNSATVTFPATTATSINLRLFDLKGSQVWSRQYQAHPGMNSVQIDCIQGLPEGEYFLHWFDKMNSQQVKILVHH
ncbi:T9SS type A sorting domain-containing protein, partial [Puia sp.]|uniref:T9SS type A sorting domain-containing protein n=1 Tax=Puia sp. TaxID=2045100 RepID=UPI002F428463